MREKVQQALTIIDVACGVIIFMNVPVIGFMLVVWAIVLAVVYRRRLMERVPRWWGDLRNVWPGRTR